jgi:hypothetical protein
MVLVAFLAAGVVPCARPGSEESLDPFMCITGLTRCSPERRRQPWVIARPVTWDAGRAGTLALSPIGDYVVLEDPAPFEGGAGVRLTLVVEHAGTVTIEAPVTGPGTPWARPRAGMRHLPGTLWSRRRTSKA